MYRLINLTLDKTTTYKNKDLVYQALERENAKVKHLGAESFFLVEELDKKNVVQEQEDIYLPFDGIAESLFLQKGLKETDVASNEKRRFSFFKPSKSQNNKKHAKEKKESVSQTPLTSNDANLQPVKPNSFISKLARLLQVLLVVISLSVACLGVTLTLNQATQVTSLSQQVKSLTNVQSETGRLDTFVRYFLPHYYSDQKQFDEFASSSLDLKNQSGQLLSVILESVSQSGKETYQLTYVLAIKDGDTKKQRRLTLVVKKQARTTYGYQLIKLPTSADYPK